MSWLEPKRSLKCCKCDDFMTFKSKRYDTLLEENLFTFECALCNRTYEYTMSDVNKIRNGEKIDDYENHIEINEEIIEEIKGVE